MNVEKISFESHKVLEFLLNKDLKPDEKIAVLRSAAFTLETIIATESTSIMIRKMLIDQYKGDQK